MIIPSIPASRVVDEKGNLTNEYRIFFDQLINQLQYNVSDAAYLLPQHDDSNLSNFNDARFTSGIVYNNESKNVQVNTDGQYKPISTYEQATTAEISAIPSGQRNGRFIYDTDASALKVGVDNSFLTVTTT